jgi:hypothetical protein
LSLKVDNPGPAMAGLKRLRDTKSMGLGRVFGSKNGIHGSHIEGIVGKRRKKERKKEEELSGILIFTSRRGYIAGLKKFRGYSRAPVKRKNTST